MLKRNCLAVALFFGATFIQAEVSAFGAGDLNDSTPYGLTSNERILKDRIEALSNEKTVIDAKINAIDDKIEGLQSVLEGVNLQYNKANLRLSQIEELENNLSKEFTEFKAYVEENRKIQEANNQQFKKVLLELSVLVDSINTSYAIKDTQNPDTSATTSQKLNTQPKFDTSNLTALVQTAISDYEKNDLDSAAEKFHFLADKKHQPARSNFYLGEIAYKQEKWQEALTYYKKSTALYSKRIDYMPRLLYHSAISLDKLGDIATANTFYSALKQNYPDSAEAKASPNRQ